MLCFHNKEHGYKKNIANVIKTKTELVIIRQRQVLGLCSKGLWFSAVGAIKIVFFKML